MRYAIYFAPQENSALWRAGCQWLGRNPASGAYLEQPDVPVLGSAVVRELTASPRRYGFHATLKSPFALTEGASQEMLFSALAAFARSRGVFRLPRLEVGNLGGFLALRLSQPCGELDALAADCVSHFDEFRRAPTRAELAQRGAGLSARQQMLLQRWGYPYVMEEWRFHMTLTGLLERDQIETLGRFLADWFDIVQRDPVSLSDLCVFIQPELGGEFRLAGRFPLAG